MEGFLYLLEKERQNEFLRQSECDRMNRLAMASHPGRQRYNHILARVGLRLTVLGTSLQERYGDMAPRPLIIIGVER